MAYSFFDYDPLTGIRTLWDYEEDTGQAHFKREQDVEPLLEFAKMMRANSKGNRIKRGTSEEWYFAYAIPQIIEMEIRKRGIDPFHPENGELVAKIMEKDYPAFKMTDEKVWLPT